MPPHPPFVHAPLDRLDFVDLGKGQVLAVDERLDGVQEHLAEPLIPGDRPNLDRACRSQVLPTVS